MWVHEERSGRKMLAVHGGKKKSVEKLTTLDNQGEKARAAVYGVVRKPARRQRAGWTFPYVLKATRGKASNPQRSRVLLHIPLVLEHPKSTYMTIIASERITKRLYIGP